MKNHSWKTVANPLAGTSNHYKKATSRRAAIKPTTSMVHVVAVIAIFVVSLAISATAQNILAQVAVPSNDCCQVAVNVALNKIYVSGGYLGGQGVFVIDGATFTGSDVGTGSTVSVDIKDDNYWAATVYGGSAVVRKGSDNSTVATVNTGGCPVNTAFNCKSRRVWVGAQCGGGNDPLFAIDADKFDIVAGPIGSGGVLGATVVNPATGRLYMSMWQNGGSKRVNPKTFAVTTNAFGYVKAVNPVNSRLYAMADNTLQIINGSPDPELVTASINLGYSPTYIGVNNALGHLYISNPLTSQVEIRDGTKGTLITSFSLGAGVAPQGIAVDSTRGRVYIGGSSGGGSFLYAIEDLSTARKCLAAGTC